MSLSPALKHQCDTAFLHQTEAASLFQSHHGCLVQVFTLAYDLRSLILAVPPYVS